MSPLDASFLDIEDSVSPMHIGSVSIFEGPPPPYAALLDMVDGKLPLLPRYRQVVRRVPFDLGRPVWADDPYFNVEYHIRHSALPRPGGEEQLCNLVGRVMSQRLDRARPLWEMWMVEGVEGDRWAVVSKVHHSMADGVSGSDLLSLILDLTPEAAPLEPTTWVPALPPAGWELAIDALSEIVRSPFEIARLLRVPPWVQRRAVVQMVEFLSSLRATAASVRGASSTSINGPLGPHRRWANTSVPVEDVKGIRRRLGGTFNDVVLAAVTRGFRDLLAARGECLELPLRSLVPVSVRGRDERGMAVGDHTIDNKLSAVFADLPVHLSDPLARLQVISGQMAGLKESRQALAGETLTELTGFAPPLLLSLAGRLGTRVPQRTINTVTTNVPGPQLPLYAVGKRMLKVYPYTPLGIQMRIAVAIFSYDGDVGFGITGDYDGAPDIHILADGVTAGISELLSFEERPAVSGLPDRSEADGEGPQDHDDADDQHDNPGDVGLHPDAPDDRRRRHEQREQELPGPVKGGRPHAPKHTGHT
jgi:WS/DGAT/MGAT family acyltransferase